MPNLNEFMAVPNTQSGNSAVLGKLVYFSLANVRVTYDELDTICRNSGIVYDGRKVTAASNAFRTATSDVYERIVSKTDIFKVYCRDNKVDGDIISRELVKETVLPDTNDYCKLANIWFNKSSNEIGYNNLEYDPDVVPQTYCNQAVELFEKYKKCASTKHIETIAQSYLDQISAIKINVHGRMYFVPNASMHRVDAFEDFIESLDNANINASKLDVNSMYVMDDEKQRRKMAEEFYICVKKEIEEYQERIHNLIVTGCSSLAVIDRWVLKVEALEQKKQQYEELLRQKLDLVSSEFSELQMFKQELQIRYRNISAGKGRAA